MRKLKKNIILTSSMIVLVIIILVITISTQFNIRVAEKNLTSIYNDRVLPLQQIKVVSDAYSKNVRCIKKVINGIINPDTALAVLDFNSKQIELNWNKYLKTFQTPEEKLIVQRAEVLKTDVNLLFYEIANILKHKGSNSLDSNLMQQIDLYELNQKTEAFETCLDELTILQTKESENLKFLTKNIFKKTLYFVLLIGGMCILVFWLVFYKHHLEQIVAEQTHNLKKQNDKLNIAYDELQASNKELDYANEQLYKTNEELAFVNKQLLDSKQQLECYNNSLEENVLERTLALKESEKKYRYIIDHSTLGIFQRTIDGKYIYFNQMLCDLFECETQEEFLSHYGQFNQTWYEQDEFNRFLEVLIQNNSINGLEVKIKLIDGSLKWVLLSATYEPEISVINGFILDITKEKQKEIVLREYESKIKAVYDLSYGFIALLTPEGKFIEANQTLIKFLETSYEEIIGKPIWKTPLCNHSTDDQEIIKNAVNKAAQGEMIRFEIKHYGNNNTNRFFDFTLKPVKDSNGKVIWLIPEGHEITERKRAEEKLRLTESLMERQVLNSVIETEERERMHFSQELHDGLGPLLSAAKMYIQLLRRQDEEVVRKEIMNDIEKLLGESSKTVREISFKLSPHILQNYGLLEAIKAYAEKVNESSTIEFRIESDGLLHLNERIETVMYRVICECITNTIKHAEADRISIKLNRTNDLLLVDYFDNGKGFDINELRTSFSGIGLLNIQSRIRTINGSMNITSMPQKGTSINFKILPL